MMVFFIIKYNSYKKTITYIKQKKQLINILLNILI